MVLSFLVDKQIITRVDKEKVVRDSMNYLYASFEFSPDWVGEKTAVFKSKSGAFNVLLDNDGKCLVPWEVLVDEVIEVSVFCGALITANVVKIITIGSGYTLGESGRVPTPGIYEQIIAKLNEIEAEIEPEAIQALIDAYLADKDFVTEAEVETIVAAYVNEHKSEWQGSEVTVTAVQQSGTKIAEISVDGTTTNLYAPNPDGIPNSFKTEELSVLSDLEDYWTVNNPIVIGFSTDQHLDDSYAKIEENIVPGLKTMADLTKHFPFNIVVLGGDSSSTSTSLSAKQQNVETITESLDGAYCPVFHLIGNHDATQDVPSMTASAAFSAHRTMPIKQKYAVVTDESTNCYYDDPTSNIRFIMICSESFSAYSNTNSRTFLANALATLPNDYKAIIFSHRPLGNLADDPETRVDDWNEPLGWGDTVNPYAGKIIVCICGHVHADKSVVKDGILYLSTTCAGWYELNDGSQRSIYDGTPQSTAYDVFVIDRDTHTIHCVRFGNGQNRNIQYPIGYTNVISESIDTNGDIYNGIGYKLGTRLNSQGTETASNNAGVTGFIPVEIGDVVRLKNFSLIGASGVTHSTDYIGFYDSSFSKLLCQYSNSAIYTDETNYPLTYINPILDANNKITQFTVPQFAQDVGENVVYMRISSQNFVETAIITLNEEI